MNRARGNRDSKSTGRRRAGAVAARLAAFGTGLAALAIALAAPASAHVRVSGVGTVQGGSGVITFRVPSESATASTTGLLITFPATAPFTSVDTQPKAGWTAKVVRKPLATPVTGEDGSEITQYVAQVDFTATSRSTAIPPGEFDMFNLSVGPFPKTASMSFAASQTYSDGSTVNWDEKSADGVTEPAHPAPVLDLTAAGTAGGSSPAPTVSMPMTSATARVAGGSTSWTGVAALIVALAALLVSGVVLVAGRNGRRVAAE